MRLRRQRKKPLAEINIVPYIDVMLVLLVIFMIATPLINQGVNVSLPKANAVEIKTQQQIPLIVTVNASGQYFLNTDNNSQSMLSPKQLLIRVAAELQVDRKQGVTRQVLVKGDAEVLYGKVVQAMVLLQQAGVPQVGLMTQANSINK